MKIIIQEIAIKHESTNEALIVLGIINPPEIVRQESFYMTFGEGESSDLTGDVVDAVLNWANVEHSYNVTEADILLPSIPRDYKNVKKNTVETYLSGVKKEGLKIAIKTADVVNGSAVFHLTDDGTETGAALFTEIFEDGIILVSNNSGVSLTKTINAISPNNKTLTLDVRKLSISLGVLSLDTEANGESVSVVVFGK